MRALIATIVLFGVMTGSAGAFDRFVNPRGTCGLSIGNTPQHATIQEAVDAALPGNAIGVCPDFYSEGATIPATKTGISLIAIGTVTLQSLSIPSFSGFEVLADDVTIERFQISDWEDAGITVDANRATIQNNNIQHNGAGIFLSGDGHRVRNNVLERNIQFGLIGLDVNGLDISGNRVIGGDAGILLGNVDLTSVGTVVHHNTITRAIVAIGVDSAGGGTIRNNTARFSEGPAIVAVHTAGLTIAQNLVNKNVGTGIKVDDATSCGIGLNSVSVNGVFSTVGHGIELTNIDGCLIARNNVARNDAPDCVWDGTGTNTFVANACGSEAPAGAWD